MMIYRNDDPPDEPEIPECCGEEMDDQGDCCVCAHCGARLPYDAYEGDFELDACEYVEPPEPPPHCPHGNDRGDCSACDHAGDLAYDAAREQRHSR